MTKEYSNWDIVIKQVSVKNITYSFVEDKASKNNVHHDVTKYSLRFQDLNAVPATAFRITSPKLLIYVSELLLWV